MPLKNFDFNLTDIKGDEITDGEKHILVKDVVVGMLGSMFQDEPNLTGKEKFERFELALKINAGGDVDVKPEEIVIIKKVVGKGCTPFAVGRIYQFLDA